MRDTERITLVRNWIAGGGATENPASEVLSRELQGEAVTKSTFKVALNTYLTAGKLGYESFKDGQFVNAGNAFRELLTGYLGKTDLSQLGPAGTRIQDVRAKA